MVMPLLNLMMKELTVKASMAYDDKHFKETVDAFVAGKTYPTLLTGKTDDLQASSKAWRKWSQVEFISTTSPQKVSMSWLRTRTGTSRSWSQRTKTNYSSFNPSSMFV